MEINAPKSVVIKKNTDIRIIAQFYNIPPSQTISLEDFETFAIQRLKVLKCLEFLSLKFNPNTEAFDANVRTELENMNSNFFVTANKSSSREYEIDQMSHFILRLSYCKTEDLRQWFLQQECLLFRLRLLANLDQVQSIINIYNLDYTSMLIEKTDPVFKKIQAFEYINSNAVSYIRVYKVRFLEVLELVRNRNVYLEKGYVYITEKNFHVVLISLFRLNLSKNLAIFARALPQLEEEERLLPLLERVNSSYMSEERTAPIEGSVSPEMLDKLSKLSFPPCMKVLHESLRTNHHMKHFGRLQYGLFLKDIGMKLEDSLRFWRDEFCKNISTEDFDKKYSYSVRHYFGKEGGRRTYSAYNCMKIITSNPPGAGDCHGCPFKHMDKENLTLKLRGYNIKKNEIDEVVKLSSNGHYQVACSRLFEFSHSGSGINNAINRPEEFFDLAQKSAK